MLTSLVRSFAATVCLTALASTAHAQWVADIEVQRSNPPYTAASGSGYAKPPTTTAVGGKAPSIIGNTHAQAGPTEPGFAASQDVYQFRVKWHNLSQTINSPAPIYCLGDIAVVLSGSTIGAGSYTMFINVGPININQVSGSYSANNVNYPLHADGRWLVTNWIPVTMWTIASTSEGGATTSGMADVSYEAAFHLPPM